MSGWSHKSPAALHSALDDAGLSAHEFRVLLTVCRRHGDGSNGQKCTAGVDLISKTCRIYPDTVRKILKRLVMLGWLVAIPRSGATTIYIPCFPDPSLKGRGVVDQGRGESGEGLAIEGGPPSDFEGGEGLAIEGGEGIQLRDPTKGSISKREKSPERVPSTDEIQFANWFKSSLPQDQQDRLPKNWLKSWCEIHDKLVRIDKRDPEQIRAVCQWARTDDFWKDQFRSPAKLRDRDKQGTLYFDVFVGRMATTTNSTTGRTVDIGRRRHAGEYPQPHLELP